MLNFLVKILFTNELQVYNLFGPLVFHSTKDIYLYFSSKGFYFSLTHKYLAFFDDISVVGDRFGRSLQFYNLEIDKEAISDGCRSEIPGIGGVFEFM